MDVSAEGVKFDPPVKPAQLPAGAWYCDMGTVHWAATDRPEDGNCPVCGMKLKQLEPSGTGATGDAAEAP